MIRNEQPWQISTNFRVYGAQDRIKADLAHYPADGTVAGESLGGNHWRYISAGETLRKADGLLSPEQGMDLLSTIST